MLRVLHFVSTPAIWSGVMGVIMNYYRHLDRSRIQFDFLCFLPCEDSYEAEIRTLGGQVFFLPRPGLSPYALKALRDFFKEHGKTYLWLHNHEVYLSFLLRPLSKRCGIENFIIHSHATRYSDRPIAAIRNRLLCLPIRFMDCRRFACSREAGTFLFGTQSVKKGTVMLLHNAIAAASYRYVPEIRSHLKRQLGLKGRFVIGHVGRFVPQKNHFFLLSVFEAFRKGHPDADLILIGDGPLKEAAIERCRELKLEEHVFFLGACRHVAELFNVMDLFVLPSIFEGIGVALIEAQANGLTGLASDCIPREADVTGRVEFLPLKPALWVKKLAACRCFLEGGGRECRIDAEEVSAAFSRKGYEIINEAKKLEAYYEDTDTHVYLQRESISADPVGQHRRPDSPGQDPVHPG